MNKFVPSEVERFLASLDGRLSGPVYLEVIGSTAAMLAFGLVRDTKDFDVISPVEAITDAWNETVLSTGLPIPLDKVSVHQPPYEYASRLQVLDTPQFKNIKISVPEKHDWAIMKIARGHDKDMEHVTDVGLRIGFDKDVFLSRFIDEMHMSHGNKGELVYCFLAAMERLFGSAVANDMGKVIRVDSRWRC